MGDKGNKKESTRLLNLGMDRGRAGDLRGAETAFQKALASDPDNLRALILLAELYFHGGRMPQAVAALHRAVERHPKDAEAHFQLGATLSAAGDVENGIRMLRRAVKLDPRHAIAHRHLGDLLRARGDTAAAMAPTRRAMELAPEDPETRVSMGLLCYLTGDPEGALTHYDHALGVAPGHSGAVIGKATVLQQEGRFEEEEALLDPYARSRAPFPDLAVAFAEVARPRGREDDARAWIESLLKRPDLPPKDRPHLHHQMGALLDRAGDYDGAFGHHRQANELVRGGYDPDAHERWIDQVIAAFSPEALSRLPNASNDSKLPVYIVGMPRSGTTLVEQIIASHPRAAGGGERMEVPALLQHLSREAGAPFPQCLTHVTGPLLDRLADGVLGALGRVDPKADRVTDKLPANALLVGLIAMLFPRARVIHTQRDPVDTCLSCYFQGFTQKLPYTGDLAWLGRYQQQTERIMAHWAKVLSIPILPVRYEELVADQEAVSRDIIDFVGLEWDEACLRFYETRRSVKTASYEQVRRPIYTSSLERWRRYQTHLGPLLDILGRKP